MAETILSAAEKASAVLDYMRHTTGTSKHHRHWLDMLYTDGMLFVADTCGAHWLIDLVASWQPRIKRKHGQWADFQVWRLRALKRDRDGEPEKWEVSAWSDTPGKSAILARQVLTYSDFPESLCLPDSQGFQFWVEGGVALLREEH